MVTVMISHLAMCSGLVPTCLPICEYYYISDMIQVDMDVVIQ